MDNKNLYDAIVIGGGPAGLSAALYLARAKYRVLVLEKESFGGQIKITSEVVNYPGVETASGKSLTETMRIQAENFGAEFMLAEAESLELDGDIKTVKTSRGDLKAFAVLVATGANPRRIGFKGENEFQGRGVAYCATCDGEFFTGLDVFVIGGGFAAAEEAMFLTKYAKKVTVMVREPDFTCAKSIADEVKKHDKIEIHYNTEVKELTGDDALRKAVFVNNQTGEEFEYTPLEGETFGVFVFAGYVPNNTLVKGHAELNPQGYVVTDETKMTTKDGLYAAGDLCIKNLRQVVTAVADGAIAATEMEKYCHNKQKVTGLKPVPPVAVDRSNSGVTGASKLNTNEKANSNEYFESDVKNQLVSVFQKMQNKLTLRVQKDDREISKELEFMVDEMVKISNGKLEKELATDIKEAPFVEILKEGKTTGIGFHGVPGGHEFNSFVIGLYNAAGPGQSLDDRTIEDINRIKEPVNLKVVVSLSCTMCPEVVMSTQRIATLSDNVTAEAYDMNHFGELKDKYKIMSVPCLIMQKGGEETVSFGKKNINQVLDLILR